MYSTFGVERHDLTWSYDKEKRRLVLYFCFIVERQKSLLPSAHVKTSILPLSWRGRMGPPFDEVKTSILPLSWRGKMGPPFDEVKTSILPLVWRGRIGQVKTRIVPWVWRGRIGPPL